MGSILKGIVSEDIEEIQSMLNRLWSVVENIAPEGSERYGVLIKHPDKELFAAQIIESGFYWKNTKAELTKIERDSIKVLTKDWFNEEL